jgi:hypothetical protein
MHPPVQPLPPLPSTAPSTVLSITTDLERHQSPQIFIHCAHLMARAAPDTIYYLHGGTPYQPRDILLAGAPSEMFVTWILTPIILKQICDITSNVTHLLDQVLNAGSVRLQFAQIYVTAALNLDFFHRLYSVDCWSVTWGAPIATALNFHVYNFQALLLSRQFAKRQLPFHGLSLTQALDLGRLSFHLFALLGVCQWENQFTIESFSSTEFGRRLLYWSQIPSQPHAQRAWETHAKACSLFWFMHLSNLFLIYHEWTMMHRFQADFGFHDVCSHADLPVVLMHPNVKAHPGSHSPTLSA